jgi:hypothetical protein
LLFAGVAIDLFDAPDALPASPQRARESNIGKFHLAVEYGPRSRGTNIRIAPQWSPIMTVFCPTHNPAAVNWFLCFCPERPPTPPFGRLGYDEQKAHLVLTLAGLETEHGRAAETTGSAWHAIDDETRRRSKQPGSGVGDASSARGSRGWWNCEQWQAELRAWPVERIEQSIAVRPRQRGAFYTLAAAVQQAADTLADSCPQDTSVTPVARVLELKKKLDGVRKSIVVLRPPLSDFYEVLDSDQRSRFNDAL